MGVLVGGGAVGAGARVAVGKGRGVGEDAGNGEQPVMTRMPTTPISILYIGAREYS